jgi:hypothetical protein
MEKIFTFLTPATITMLTSVSLLFLTIIIVGVLLAVFRAKEWAKAILWLPKEVIAIYSNGDSFFSKKRIESSMAFFFSLGASACYVWIRRNTITTPEFMWIISVWLFIAGYTVSQIQKEKGNGTGKTDAPEVKPTE